MGVDGEPPEEVAREPTQRRRERAAREPDGPSFLTMIGLVAVVVAAVILVFFAIGYLLGRVFL